jgi:N6-adenosine-specific RNA methylase IME4
VTDPDNNQQSSSLNSLSVVGLGSLTPSIVSTLDVLVNRRVKFATVYADPPWPYSNTASRAAAENHYRTMTLDAIRNEPVKSVAAENSHLHLWTTNAFLREAFDVMHDWGFKYKSCLIWVKPQLGMGNYWRVSHEYLLFGIRGDLPFRSNKVRSWQSARRTAHSRKPFLFRGLIEQVSPGPYLELYGREEQPNSDWTVYGNQVERRLF